MKVYYLNYSKSMYKTFPKTSLSRKGRTEVQRAHWCQNAITSYH